MDDDNSKALNFSEFKKASHDYQFGLSEEEIQKVFLAFDNTGNGQIDYEEFLREVRGQMNDFRIQLVEQAFRTLDRTRNGVVEIDDLKGVYDTSNHPDVKQGKKTEDQVLSEFLQTFEQHF